MEEELYKRIGEADLNPTYKDGQVYQHTDVNNMLSILKTAINENYFDIQKIENGEKDVGNAKKLIIPCKGKNFTLKIYGSSSDYLSIESFGFVLDRRR